MNQYNIKNKKLDVKEFQHPADKRAVDAVTAIPGFEKIVDFISKNSIERVYSFMNNSSRLKITDKMSPKMSAMISEAAEMFNSERIPDIYIERSYIMRIVLEGVKNPFVIFSTSILEQISDEMLWPVMVSEIAGIQAKHAVIKFIDSLLGFGGGLLPFGADIALGYAISDWYRNKAYTYDRAILLASENFELTAKHILFGEASGDVLESLKLADPDSSYLEQANEFLRRKGADGAVQKLNTVFSKNQWAASRYMELYNWYHTGNYHDIIERSEG